jgi:hypothetical protein
MMTQERADRLIANAQARVKACDWTADLMQYHWMGTDDKLARNAMRKLQQRLRDMADKNRLRVHEIRRKVSAADAVRSW